MAKKTVPTWTGGGGITFRLHRVFVHEFSVVNPTKSFQRDEENGNVDFAYTIASEVVGDPGSKGLFNLNVIIRGIIRQTSELILITKMTFAFGFRGIPDGVDIADVLDSDPNLVLQLVSMAYSTSRGIVFNQGKGTILQQDLLPTVDPRVLAADVIKSRRDYLDGIAAKKKAVGKKKVKGAKSKP